MGRRNTRRVSNQGPSSPNPNNQAIEESMKNPEGTPQDNFQALLINMMNEKMQSMMEELRADINKKLSEIEQRSNERLATQQNQIDEVKKSVQDLKETFTSEMETIKKDHLEGREMKNKVESLERRIEQAEDRISDIEDSHDLIEKEHRSIQNLSKKQDRSLQELQDAIRRPNIRLIGIEENQEKEVNGVRNLFKKIIEENFPNIQKDGPIQIQEAFRTPNRVDQNRTSHRHIVIHTGSVETKERILKAAREKGTVTYKGKTVRITPDFSPETMKARKAWTEICQALKKHNYQPRIQYPAKLSFIAEGKIRTFHSKEKLKQYISTKPALQKILNNILYSENQRDQDPNGEMDSR